MSHYSISIMETTQPPLFGTLSPMLGCLSAAAQLGFDLSRFFMQEAIENSPFTEWTQVTLALMSMPDPTFLKSQKA